MFKFENLEIDVFGSIKLSSLDTITETGVTVVIPCDGSNLNDPATAPVVVSIPESVKIGEVLFATAREYEPSGLLKVNGSSGSQIPSPSKS